MRILKKWQLLAPIVILLVALLGISSSVAFADSPPTSGCDHTMVVYGVPGSVGTYMDIYLDGVGPLPGWCASDITYITVGHTYTDVCLYDYFVAPQDIPSCDASKDWHRIAYVINHKQGTWNDVQHAIWWFTNGLVPSTQAAIDMVAAAQANGANYVPAEGQLKPIICFVNCNVQCVFYEYTTPTEPVPEMPTVLLLGLGLVGVGGFVWYRRSRAGAA